MDAKPFDYGFDEDYEKDKYNEDWPSGPVIRPVRPLLLPKRARRNDEIDLTRDPVYPCILVRTTNVPYIRTLSDGNVGSIFIAQLTGRDDKFKWARKFYGGDRRGVYVDGRNLQEMILPLNRLIKIPAVLDIAWGPRRLPDPNSRYNNKEKPEFRIYACVTDDPPYFERVSEFDLERILQLSIGLVAQTYDDLEEEVEKVIGPGPTRLPGPPVSPWHVRRPRVRWDEEV